MTFKTMQQRLLKQERSKPDGQNIVYNISWLWNFVTMSTFLILTVMYNYLVILF